LATDVDHPLADFVTAALMVAAENHVRDLVSLLTHLAECCRDDVRMRTRVWVARARLRSAVRIIVAVIVSFVAGLLLLQRDYLRAYASGAVDRGFAGDHHDVRDLIDDDGATRPIRVGQSIHRS